MPCLAAWILARGSDGVSLIRATCGAKIGACAIAHEMRMTAGLPT